MNYPEKEILSALVKNARQYSQYEGTFLDFWHTKSVKFPPERSRIYFGQENFMHLVGVDSHTCSAAGFFQKCLDGTVAIEDCTPVHAASNRWEKIMLFPSLFNFSNSKFYKFGEKDFSTLYDDFTFATGNDDGTVGYDVRDEEFGAAIPVTLVKQPIFHYCSEPHRIIAVFQENNPVQKSGILLYEAKKGLYDSLMAAESIHI